MAFISSAFTAGQTLTAASMEDLRGNANAGHSVFTNEAARDAAITAPTEGMMAYLTAPTVPAATGATTEVPSGIVTIYNGSVWVCTTPVAANTATECQMINATYGLPTTAGGTNPSVTLVTGTSARIDISAGIRTSTTDNSSFMAVAVSGATTLAAATTYSIIGVRSVTLLFGRSIVLPGLTAGTNTFTLHYATSSGLTGYFVHRHLVVQGIA